MDLVEDPFDHCAFSDNRDRLIEHEAIAKFFRKVVERAEKAGLMSAEHFSVDGHSHRGVGFDEELPTPRTTMTTTVTRTVSRTSKARSAATKRTSRRPIRSRS